MKRQIGTKKLGAVLVGAVTAVLFLSSGAISSAQGSSTTVPVATTVPTSSSGATTPASSANPATTVLQSPAIPGVSPLPGPVVDPATPSDNMGILDVTPDQGVAGTPITISGSHLAPNTQTELTWSTANATWMVQTEPDTVNYLGRTDTLLAVKLATATTDAQGSFKLSLKAPVDWGGVHDIYAVVNGVEVAHGGYIMLRTVTVSPASGPVGTPITITYSGLGPTLYTGGASLLYDNHYVGELMANWTRGTAQVTIRASGTVGKHVIQIGNAISYLYLNVPQSPIPYTNGAKVIFTVTRDSVAPGPSIDWPVDVAPTLSARTTLQASGLAVNSNVDATLRVDHGAGGLQRRPHGIGPDEHRSGQPGLVDGRRQPRGLRQHVLDLCLHTAGDGDARRRVAASHHQGPRRAGWLACRPAHAKRPNGGPSALLHRGEHRRPGRVIVGGKRGPVLHHPLEGCGMDAAGQHRRCRLRQQLHRLRVRFQFQRGRPVAPQRHRRPGVHLIDLYPMLYSLSPSFANTPYGMVPVLTYAQDYPGLALGYHMPAIRLAITVVK